MRRSTGMPKLREHVSAPVMDSVGYFLPAGNLLVRIKSGRSKPAASGNRDGGCLRDDEPTLGSTLPVILGHQGTRDISGLLRTRTGQRRHHHAVR